MIEKRKLFLVLLQIVIWAAFIAVPYIMVPQPPENTTPETLMKFYGPQSDRAQNVFLSSLLFNGLLIIFFYIHHRFLFDRFIVTRRLGAYIAIITCSYLGIYAVSYLFRSEFFPQLQLFHSFFAARDWIRALTWFLLVLLVSLGMKLLGQWRQAEQKAREIENERLRTELSFLHAQINPHFLFNSLNTIYSLALKKSDTAPSAILKLSQLLRYVVDEANHEKVPLAREVDYLNNYVELQKLRTASTLLTNFKIEGEIDSAQITPLLLLPFVENAFKYGVSNTENSPVDILLAMKGNEVIFSVKNRKFRNEGFRDDKNSSGIGINNVQRRLELVYPFKHQLKIDDTQEFFNVNLTINLS